MSGEIPFVDFGGNPDKTWWVGTFLVIAGTILLGSETQNLETKQKN